MFGRATIRLGIGPHSSSEMTFSVLYMQDDDASVDYSRIEPSAESAAPPRRSYLL